MVSQTEPRYTITIDSAVVASPNEIVITMKDEKSRWRVEEKRFKVLEHTQNGTTTVAEEELWIEKCY